MQKRNVHDAEKVLRSPRTALAIVRGVIPPGARKGDRFDVEISVPARDQTTSLEGGWLLEVELKEKAAVDGVGVLSGRTLGKAAGPILTTMSTDAAVPAEPRRGRILGGGVAKIDRDFTLLTDSTHRSARYTMEVSKRINERYRNPGRDAKPIAEAKDNAQIMLQVPTAYRQNISRYLAVVRRIPLWAGPQEASQLAGIQQLERELMVAATARESAMQLEAIGLKGVPALKKGLDSPDADVRFFAAESLAYLGEPAAANELFSAVHSIPEYRAHALTALGSLDEAIARLKLRDLLSDPSSAEIRYGAFRALTSLDPRDKRMSPEVIADYVHVYRPETSGPPMIHVSSHNRAEIVLFGNDLRLLPPLQLRAGRDIMLASSDADSGLIMSSHSSRHPVRRDVSSLELMDVIRRAMAMGATYPDIVAMLTMADKNHNLPGRLEIDAYPDPARIYGRLNRLTQKPSTDAVAMPNLFQWFDRSSNKPKVKSAESASADTPGNPDQPKKYLTKPSLFDRLRGRTAN
jgi:hypothetical protein